MEVLEAFTRIAELERKLDSMFRHGPVVARKKIGDGQAARWFVRLRIGGTEQEPFLSPWVPYTSHNGGAQGLNVHAVPKEGEQMTLLSPSGDFQQGVAARLFWSNDHPPPSDDPDAVVITHPDFKLTLKDGKLAIEAKEFEFKAGSSTVTIKAGLISLTSDLIETIGKTVLGLDNHGENGSKVLTEDGPAKKTRAKAE